MLANDFLLRNLTKSEQRLLELISEDDEFDYSWNETSYLLDISRQTVYTAFKKLVNMGLVTKTYFYEQGNKRIRCKYTCTQKTKRKEQ